MRYRSGATTGSTLDKAQERRSSPRERHWDSYFKCHMTKLLPGEYYVADDEAMIVTILGSCISACIRDRTLGIGGMNHFVLPEDGRPDRQQKQWIRTYDHAATRYGTAAMERLINAILKRGGSRNNLEAKIFGGGRVLSLSTDIGERNISFVREYLSLEGIPIAREDVGGPWARKVYYAPSTGDVFLKKIKPQNLTTLATIEKDYLDNVRDTPTDGSITIFE